MSYRTRADTHALPDAPVIVDLYRARERSREQQILTAQGTYGRLVPAPEPAARLAAFSAFVRRALDQALLRRNWNVERVAAEADLGVNTLYNWRRGASAFPEGEKVRKFCDALGINPVVAFTILWPGEDERPAEPVPLGPEEDLMTLARKLSDPSVPAQEKFLIRETIRGLAARTAPPPEDKRRHATG
jgi:transcriptional regulator with XRE-family HTH domain